MDFEQILAAAASQGGGVAPETLGPECWVQPDFNASTGLSLFNASVSGGQLHFPGDGIDIQSASCTSAQTLTSGDYHYEVNVTATDGATFGVSVGGVSQNISDGTTGIKTGTITTTAANQSLSIFSGLETAVVDFTSLSIKRVL